MLILANGVRLGSSCIWTMARRKVLAIRLALRGIVKREAKVCMGLPMFAEENAADKLDLLFTRGILLESIFNLIVLGPINEFLGGLALEPGFGEELVLAAKEDTHLDGAVTDVLVFQETIHDLLGHEAAKVIDHLGRVTGEEGVGLDGYLLFTLSRGRRPFCPFEWPGGCAARVGGGPDTSRSAIDPGDKVESRPGRRRGVWPVYPARPE